MNLNRKRPEDKSETWKPKRSAHFYLDDIDELLLLTKDLGDLEIDTEDFTGVVTDAEQLRSGLEGENLAQLKLSVSGNGRSLVFATSPEILLTISPRDDLLLRGAADSLKRIISSRMRRFGAFPAPGTDDPKLIIYTLFILFSFTWAGFLSFIANPSGVSEGAEQSAPDSIDWLPLAVASGAIGLLVLLATGAWSAWGTNPRPSGRLKLVWEADAPSWWREHKAALLLGLITNSIVGAVFFSLGLIVGG